MLVVYLAALGFGGTTLLASLLLGGDKNLGSDHDADHGGADNDHDADHSAADSADHGGADVEHDADAGADHDADAGADHDADGDGDHGHAANQAPATVDPNDLWWMLLSMRFWTFGTGAFGLAGTLLTLMSVPDVVTALSSVFLGLAIGGGAARFFRALNTDQVSGETELGRFVGEEAKVVIAVRPGQVGKIVLQTLGGRVELPASTRDAKPIELGSTVIVAGVTGGVADVSRLPTEDDRGARARARDAARAAAVRQTGG